ncbi:putative quinol monooxygenase [uncultured Friedmanniella sp.]|uniref:putative quinol monooxygenase n=1 Tax=uncultured Friedmanniella sp. TaxID=335381 RepID=UPI0035CB4D4C
MFALVVRFDLHDPTAATSFDALVQQLLPGIAAHEPGTVVYTVHTLLDAPLSRIFYECYADREAFDEHERQPHTATFLRDRERLCRATRVELLTPTGGTGA